MLLQRELSGLLQLYLRSTVQGEEFNLWQNLLIFTFKDIHFTIILR